MKLQTDRTRSRLLTAGVVILTYCFLLLLSRGFVTSGDDWFFTSRTMDESLAQALKNGWANATGHYRGTNGRLLGNGFSKSLGCSEFWREIVRCGMMLTILLLICRVAKLRDLTLYAVALTMFIALPKDLYAQAYAWAAGFFNYVPPMIGILLYILRVERLLDRKKDSVLWGLAMLLTALLGQFFVENATVGLCLMSGIVFVWYLATRKKWSWSLGGHLLGAVLGCIIMLAAPGYNNVNQEGYRQVVSTFEELMKVIRTNFAFITRYLTEDNWLTIVPLTALSIGLLMGSKAGKAWIRKAAIVGLWVCPVYFYAHYRILSRLAYAQWVADIAFWLDVALNLVYLLCVLAAVLLGVADASRKCRAVLLILAVPMVFGPLAVVNPIGPRCLYIPYMLLVTLMLTLLAEVYDRFDRAQVRQLRIPVVLTAACVLSVYLWTAVWNGHCEQVRTQQIQNALSTGAASVELPSFPYSEFVHNPNGSVMKYYYFHEEAGDLEFIFIDPATWYNSR